MKNYFALALLLLPNAALSYSVATRILPALFRSVDPDRWLFIGKTTSFGSAAIAVVIVLTGYFLEKKQKATRRRRLLTSGQA